MTTTPPVPERPPDATAERPSGGTAEHAQGAAAEQVHGATTRRAPPVDSHSARYFALLYSAPPQHAALKALFGIEHEVFESLKPGLDHHVAHSRLQWWREECDRTVAGRPLHPLTRALTVALQAHAPTPAGVLPSPSGAGRAAPQMHAGLAGFVDVAVWDLASAAFESRRELTAYCERWGAAMLETIGGESIWQSIGAAIRELELLLELARDAHYGRIRLPLDELDRVKAEPRALVKPPWSDAITEILRARHRAIRGEITRGLADVEFDRQATLRGLLVWAALACRMSERAERALPNRLQPGRFDGISDAWFAWRMARKATAGRFSPS